MTKRPDTDTVIRRIIDRRLKLGGGDCQVGVRSVTKAAISKLELEDSAIWWFFICEFVVRIIEEEYDSELCDLKSMAHHEDMILAPLSLRIYQIRG